MMTSLSVHWRLPENWYSLTPDRMADGTWRRVLPDASEDSQLGRDLERFERHVRESAFSRRASVIVLAPPGFSKQVVAVGSLDVAPARGLDALVLELEARDLPANVLSRRLDRVRIAGNPAVVSYDLVGSNEEGGSVLLHERGVAVMHLADLDVNVMVEISTSDASAFEDIGASVAQALAGVSLRTRELS